MRQTEGKNTLLDHLGLWAVRDQTVGDRERTVSRPWADREKAVSRSLRSPWADCEQTASRPWSDRERTLSRPWADHEQTVGCPWEGREQVGKKPVSGLWADRERTASRPWADRERSHTRNRPYLFEPEKIYISSAFRCSKKYFVVWSFLALYVSPFSNSNMPMKKNTELCWNDTGDKSSIRKKICPSVTLSTTYLT